MVPRVRIGGKHASYASLYEMPSSFAPHCSIHETVRHGVLRHLSQEHALQT